MSYRGIIGAYYHKNYLNGTGSRKLWLNQIETYVTRHQLVGLRNPVFNYDPESYLWFIDFNRIGKDTDKAPVEEVLLTAKLILACFRIKDIYGETLFDSVWDKYEKAINLFYEQRKRPPERRMLIPTLIKPGNQDTIIENRDFVPAMFELK